MDKAALDKNESLLPFVCGAYNDDVPEAIEAMRDIFAMARECLARRAADEGAVEVEGWWWGDNHRWILAPGDPPSGHRLLRVYEEREHDLEDDQNRIPVTVTIRCRAEKG